MSGPESYWRENLPKIEKQAHDYASAIRRLIALYERRNEGAYFSHDELNAKIMQAQDEFVKLIKVSCDIL